MSPNKNESSGTRSIYGLIFFVSHLRLSPRPSLFWCDVTHSCLLNGSYCLCDFFICFTSKSSLVTSETTTRIYRKKYRASRRFSHFIRFHKLLLKNRNLVYFSPNTVRRRRIYRKLFDCVWQVCLRFNNLKTLFICYNFYIVFCLLEVWKMALKCSKSTAIWRKIVKQLFITILVYYERLAMIPLYEISNIA